MNLKKAVNRQPSLGKWRKQTENQGKSGRNFRLSKTAPAAEVQPHYQQLAPELQGLLKEIKNYLS